MRWWVLGWGATALGATAVVGWVGVSSGPWPEPVHLLGHLGLCGGMAALAATALGGSPRRRALGGLVAAMLLGAAIELVQLPLGPPLTAVLYDLAVDGLSAVAGVVLWAAMGPAAAVVGHLVSAVLHPVVVAPVALGAVSATEPSWLRVAAGGLCLLPAVATWVAGTRWGWWSDGDLSRRRERGPLFVMATLGAVGFAAVVHGVAAPLPAVAWAGAAGALGVTAVTLAGLKASGHVAVPVALAVALGDQGGELLLATAVLLSWARIAAGRHRPYEVGVGWLIGLLAGLLGGVWS